MDRKEEKRRPWTCKNGHVLGYLRRVRVDRQNGFRSHETRLDVLRHAINLDAEMPVEADVLLTLTAFGGALHIRCDVPGCGAARPWDVSADLLDQLVASVIARR